MFSFSRFLAEIRHCGTIGHAGLKGRHEVANSLRSAAAASPDLRKAYSLIFLQSHSALVLRLTIPCAAQPGRIVPLRGPTPVLPSLHLQVRLPEDKLLPQTRQSNCPPRGPYSLKNSSWISLVSQSVCEPMQACRAGSPRGFKDPLCLHRPHAI